MNYRQAEDYIFSFTDYEKIPAVAYTAANYDLRRMEILLQPLGNPHLGTKTIHIAGTKGKGSTAAMISQALITAGYKTGLFTSPHLNTVRERIRINDRTISKTDFAALVTEIRPIVDTINKKASFGKLTSFEILTAVAFTYFKRNKLNYQVVEVGLGGRLDATNVVEPDVCIITSISLDHTEILGQTLAKIAVEKAGIIKGGCSVVSAPQDPEVEQVIKEVCHARKVKLIEVGKDVTCQQTGADFHRQEFKAIGQNATYDLAIPLLGDYQLENACAAVAALEILSTEGAEISPKNITEGFRRVSWPGRFQILSREPIVLADGAHNAYSIKKLVDNVNKYFTYSKCFVIFGSSSDKDISRMVKELQALNCQIIITSSSHPRAASVSSLKEQLNWLVPVPKSTDSVKEALNRVLKQSEKTDLILITGSLFVAAEAIAYFDQKR